ncbi:hypothetical protein N658DRAFT_166051 [Parathielavia hyrcaniae]|uniref:Uncharacterized protein n=1 Tax=Parathielavia hyrcaniae TaxID=113614 RepID=A0AAN6PZH1_9PEZI|nr:hypothetical protein N658DRAFT_166051 [Parathielavia hyrcaniae]
MRRFRALAAIPSWHEHCAGHARPARFELSVRAKPGARSVHTVPYPPGYQLEPPVFDTARGTRLSIHSPGRRRMRMAASCRFGVSSLAGGPPSPIGDRELCIHAATVLRPLATQRSGPKQPADIGHQRRRPCLGNHRAPKHAPDLALPVCESLSPSIRTVLNLFFSGFWAKK